MTVEDTNWVDPDILAMEGANSGFSQEDEQGFRVFFEKDWSDPKYDAMRGSWDPLIHDPEPKIRLYSKVALWNLVRLQAMREGSPFKIDQSTST